jgi:hypothetical protein
MSTKSLNETPCLVPPPVVILDSPNNAIQQPQPYSPQSVLNIIAVYQDISHDTLLVLAKGLAKAMLDWEEYH